VSREPEHPARGGGNPRPVAILGMGNVLLGDDGAGPAVIRYLEAHYELPEEVEAEDIGTPGLDLVPHLAERRTVILVDCVSTGGPAGTIKIYPKERIAAALNTNRLSPHDPGLAESLGTLELAGEAPEHLTVVGIVPGSTETGIGLGPEVRAAVPRVAEEVVRLLAELGIELQQRPVALPLDGWWDEENAGS